MAAAMQFLGRARSGWGGRRASRIALFGLVLAGVFYMLSAVWPRDYRIEVRLPREGDDVVGLHVEFRKEGDVLRVIERRWPRRTPGRVRLDVRLPEGEYEVLVRTEQRQGRFEERLLRLTLTGDGLHHIDLRN